MYERAGVLSTAVRELSCLRAVVEVVPVVAGAHPVVVGGGVVGLVVGVGRGVVELAGLGVLAGGLGVQGGGGLTVKSLEHLREGADECGFASATRQKPGGQDARKLARLHTLPRPPPPPPLRAHTAPPPKFLPRAAPDLVEWKL
jgi:hypothetical protein